MSFVIVGGGLAAATAAEALREGGYGGPLQLFAAEPHPPYIRPPLSKDYLLGKEGREGALVHPAEWWAEHDIEVRTGTEVEALGDHEVTLASGETVPFGRALLATGATARRLRIPGSDAAGIHTLRTIEDSEALRAELERGDRDVVFVGAGWIGLELAAAARGYGNRVTVVAPEAVPLGAALGDELGGVFRELHESNGVVFRLETKVTGFEVADGRVTGVVTDAGTVPADVVVVGIGAAPDTRLAEAAGLEVAEPREGGGILVDEHLATSAPDVFAAGDVANAFHPVIGQRMRNEHWATAIASGKVAAASMRGEDAVLDEIPYFYTDQYDLGMEYSGYPPLTRDARVVYRGDTAAREFVAFWLNGARVVAGMNVNVWDVNEQVQRLIREDRDVDIAKLTDPGVDLSEI
ncbi:MAG: FAD-dependent oxidoreductase [Microbacteriaceae bacterium]|nr:FAD-dependent oxidoreductase [Microbacteriaceae bacterium]